MQNKMQNSSLVASVNSVLERRFNSIPKSWLQAILIFLLTLVIYVITANFAQLTQMKEVGYFNYLAEAFLNGRLHLVNPPMTLDLSSFEGRWYVPFPPLPALLMLPWVALAGAKGVNVVY